MRNGVARILVLGLVLAFPVLIVLASPAPRAGVGRASMALPVIAVEGVLGVGLAFAARERKRLLAQPELVTTLPARPRLAAPAPHALAAAGRPAVRAARR